jgi:hypothetical protein
VEYILNTDTCGIDSRRYKQYVDSIRDALPEHVYAFASNEAYFNLASHSSLHDTWLEELTLKEISQTGRDRVVQIHLSLLGPFHDRKIHLHYIDVSQYSLAAHPEYEEQRYQRVFHGDLITHGVRLGRDGRFVHELLFKSDATFLIECADIRHSEELI